MIFSTSLSFAIIKNRRDKEHMKGNWMGAAERQKKAEEHTDKMERFYQDAIMESLHGSAVYGPDKIEVNTQSDTSVPKFLLLSEDTVSAAFLYREINKDYSSKICLLNFASYKNPGGGFIRGALAQEEALCHESFLFDVLYRETEYYEWNNQHLNHGLYLNRAIYSPNVWFFKGKDDCVKADVLTCASPNWSVAQKNGIAKETNDRIFKERVQFIKDIVELNKPDVFITGAFGCGVFEQEPSRCVRLFKEVFSNSSAKMVIFAVPKKPSKNYEAFKDVIR